MSNPWAACGPGEGFVRSGLSFRCYISCIYTDYLICFDNFKFNSSDAVVLSATLSHLYRMLGDFYVH